MQCYDGPWYWCDDLAPGIDVGKCSCFDVFSDYHVVYDLMDLLYGSVSCGFSTIVQTGLVSNSFKSGMKYLLSYEPLLNTTLQVLGSGIAMCC